MTSQTKSSRARKHPPESHHPFDDVRERARDQRNHPTKAETALWRALRRRSVLGFKFRRQHPVGPYIVDFFCYEAMLAVEVDGEHHGSDEHADYDKHRDRELRRRGIRVLRVSDDDVLTQLDGVVQMIAAALGEHPPEVPPQGDGVQDEAAAALLSDHDAVEFEP